MVDLHTFNDVVVQKSLEPISPLEQSGQWTRGKQSNPIAIEKKKKSLSAHYVIFIGLVRRDKLSHTECLNIATKEKHLCICCADSEKREDKM